MKSLPELEVRIARLEKKLAQVDQLLAGETCLTCRFCTQAAGRHIFCANEQRYHLPLTCKNWRAS